MQLIYMPACYIVAFVFSATFYWIVLVNRIPPMRNIVWARSSLFWSDPTFSRAVALAWSTLLVSGNISVCYTHMVPIHIQSNNECSLYFIFPILVMLYHRISILSFKYPVLSNLNTNLIIPKSSGQKCVARRCFGYEIAISIHTYWNDV